jgi:hypothetical protein
VNATLELTEDLTYWTTIELNGTSSVDVLPIELFIPDGPHILRIGFESDDISLVITHRIEAEV